MKRGMYYQGNKIVNLAILILLLLFVSCNKYKDFDEKEIESISNEQLEKTFKTNIFAMFYFQEILFYLSWLPMFYFFHY